MAPASTVLQRRLAARLAQLRNACGLTQEDLAGRLGIAVRNLQRMESGRQNLTLQTIEKVARALALDLDVVVPIAEDRPSRVPVSLFVVPPLAEGRPPRPVPILTLEAAAGYARTGRAHESLGWTLIGRPVDGRAFVAQVAGRSMEPLIPDRSWSLFRSADDVAVGTIGLFEIRRTGDADDGAAYVVKRVAERSRRQTVLASVNPAGPTLTFDAKLRGDARPVAAWVTVIGSR